MRTISLRLDAESDAMLQGLCDRLDATQTDVVRQALEVLSDSVTPTPGVLGMELGLVGVFASGGRGNAAGHSDVVKARLAAQRRDEQRREEGPASPDETGAGDAKPGKRARRAPKA